MAFDNRYPNRKDNRRKYPFWQYAKSVSIQCRNHGGCEHCVSNRRIGWLRNLAKAEAGLDDFFANNDH